MSNEATPEPELIAEPPVEPEPRSGMWLTATLAALAGLAIGTALGVGVAPKLMEPEAAPTVTRTATAAPLPAETVTLPGETVTAPAVTATPTPSPTSAKPTAPKTTAPPVAALTSATAINKCSENASRSIGKAYPGKSVNVNTSSASANFVSFNQSWQITMPATIGSTQVTISCVVNGSERSPNVVSGEWTI